VAIPAHPDPIWSRHAGSLFSLCPAVSSKSGRVFSTVMKPHAPPKNAINNVEKVSPGSRLDRFLRFLMHLSNVHPVSSPFGTGPSRVLFDMRSERWHRQSLPLFETVVPGSIPQCRSSRSCSALAQDRAPCLPGSAFPG